MIYRTKYATLQIASPHITKRMCEQAQISRKVTTLKALKETIGCVYGPSPECGNEQSFSFTDTWTKESKTVNRFQKEMLQSFALTYLLPVESFCDLLCDIYI